MVRLARASSTEWRGSSRPQTTSTTCGVTCSSATGSSVSWARWSSPRSPLNGSPRTHASCFAGVTRSPRWSRPSSRSTSWSGIASIVGLVTMFSSSKVRSWWRYCSSWRREQSRHCRSTMPWWSLHPPLRQRGRWCSRSSSEWPVSKELWPSQRQRHHDRWLFILGAIWYVSSLLFCLYGGIYPVHVPPHFSTSWTFSGP